MARFASGPVRISSIVKRRFLIGLHTLRYEVGFSWMPPQIAMIGPSRALRQSIINWRYLPATLPPARFQRSERKPPLSKPTPLKFGIRSKKSVEEEGFFFPVIYLTVSGVPAFYLRSYSGFRPLAGWSMRERVKEHRGKCHITRKTIWMSILSTVSHIRASENKRVSHYSIPLFFLFLVLRESWWISGWIKSISFRAFRPRTNVNTTHPAYFRTCNVHDCRTYPPSFTSHEYSLYSWVMIFPI